MVDSLSMKMANELSIALRGREKAIDEFFDPLIEAAHKAHKALTTKRNQIKTPVSSARKTVDSRIARYIEEEEKRREEIAKEILRKAEKESEERRLALAIEAEESGQKDLAERLLSSPAAVSTGAVGLPPVRQELEGMSTFEHWSADVIDEDLLLRAVVDGRAPRYLFVVDLAALNRLAKDSKERFDVPGAVARKETRMRGGRG